MPKTIYIPEDAKHSGIDVTWTKTSAVLRIGGWYDGCVGLGGQCITLADFFKRLGITEKDCAKAFAKTHI